MTPARRRRAFVVIDGGKQKQTPFPIFFPFMWWLWWFK
jgi:hypothetical protein